MKKAKKWILLAILVVVVAGVFAYLWKQSRPKEVKYETKVVTVGTIQKTTIVTGKIEPRDEVEIKPQISGMTLIFAIASPTRTLSPACL